MSQACGVRPPAKRAGTGDATASLRMAVIALPPSQPGTAAAAVSGETSPAQAARSTAATSHQSARACRGLGQPCVLYVPPLSCRSRSAGQGWKDKSHQQHAGHQFIPLAVARGHELVEAAVRRVPRGDAADDYAIDYEIVDDRPSLRARKDALIHEVSRQEHALLVASMPPGKRRLDGFA